MVLRSGLLALALLSGGSFAEPARQEPAPQAAPAPAEARGVEVTFLANAGFFLRSGDTGVLIDSFVREPHGIYSALPFDSHQNIVLARPPYDVPITVLVSHTHPDHVQFRGLDKFLGNSPHSLFVAASPVAAALRAEARDWSAIQERVKIVEVTRGSPQTVTNGTTTITLIELPHAGKESGDARNFAHLVEIGGLRILHVGDADPRPANFEPLDLRSKKLDLVLVPYWYFGNDEGRRLVSAELPARFHGTYHVPLRELDEFSGFLARELPNVILFQQTLEKRTFEPAPATPESGNGGGGR